MRYYLGRCEWEQLECRPLPYPEGTPVFSTHIKPDASCLRIVRAVERQDIEHDRRRRDV